MSEDLILKQQRIEQLETEKTQYWNWYQEEKKAYAKAKARIAMLELVIEKLAEERNG